MDTETVEMKQIVVKCVSSDLWAQLKSRAALDKQTLQKTIAKAIEHYLKTA